MNPEVEASRPAKVPTATMLRPVESGRQLNVMLVEDNIQQQKLVALILAQRGYRVTAFANGEDAWRACQREAFDLIVTDWAVPGMDGLELCRRLRSLPEGDRIVILVQTGRSQPEDLSLVLEAGASDYLAKPYSTSLLEVRLAIAEREFAMIAERKNAMEALRAANRELESFSYSVSHDLRAPLRGIDGFSRILMEDYGSVLPQEALRYLGIIRDGTVKMGQLIDDLLSFSRLSRQQLRSRPIEPESIAREIAADLTADLGGRSVEFVWTPMPPCVADPALVRQIYSNLIGNALKYSHRREVSRIEIGAIEGATEPTYFVRDNGVGFDMAYVHKLFGVFQRLHRAEEYEGTGVGLAIVQRIVHRHGGRVWAEGVDDRGATFYFTLPGIEETLDMQPAESEVAFEAERR